MSSSHLASLTEESTRNLGAKIVPEGVHYTAWAPERRKVEVVIGDPDQAGHRSLALRKYEDGYFTCLDSEGQVGDLYTFTVDGRKGLPDLASRYQPQGLFGSSMVIDPLSYSWQTMNWKRPAWGGHVIYELHIGTFTQEGTFRAAIDRIDYLADLGITIVELMPVVQSAGERNWGYDGVLLFAPYHAYGKPDDLRQFIDACHAHGIAVMLDMVYNHIGAIGDPTDAYSKFLSHPENTGAWGKSYNLYDENSAPVRHLLLQNIDYWLEEFRVDGFRLDATHAIRDKSKRHLLIQVSELIHAHGAFVNAEDERNAVEILKPRSEDGWQMDAVWADDFHHSLRVSQTREKDSFLGCYTGSLDEIADTLQHGWHFRGQVYPRLGKPRGTACDHLAPERFIYCISNHDQVGNRPFGERLHQSISPEAYRALSLFFCFIPYTPLLFMGQEWVTSSPFLFFTDHPENFGWMVSEGRAREFLFDAREHGRPIPDCQSESTFLASKLHWDELEQPFHAGILTLYREGLKLRRQFFDKGNPDRSCWEVETGSNQLILNYELPRYSLNITLCMSRNGRETTAPRNETWLRSSDPRFGNDSGEGPETVVRFRRK